MAYIMEDNAYWDRKYNRNSNIMMDYHTSYNLCDSLMDLLNQNHDPNQVALKGKIEGFVGKVGRKKIDRKYLNQNAAQVQMKNQNLVEFYSHC